jgi:TPR repeat protein
VLIAPIELLHRAKMHDSAADTHGESDMHHTQMEDGNLFMNGVGVPKSDAQAAVWFEKAAAKGDDEAQCNLGILLEDYGGVQVQGRPILKHHD